MTNPYLDESSGGTGQFTPDPVEVLGVPDRSTCFGGSCGEYSPLTLGLQPVPAHPSEPAPNTAACCCERSAGWSPTL